MSCLKFVIENLIHVYFYIDRFYKHINSMRVYNFKKHVIRNWNFIQNLNRFMHPLVR